MRCECPYCHQRNELSIVGSWQLSGNQAMLMERPCSHCQKSYRIRLTVSTEQIEPVPTPATRSGISSGFVSGLGVSLLVVGMGVGIWAGQSIPPDWGILVLAMLCVASGLLTLGISLGMHGRQAEDHK